MKQKRFIKLTQDLMFKNFFSKDEKVLISLLKSFLPALQDKQIETIQILNPETQTRNILDNKESYFKKAGQTDILNNPTDRHEKDTKIQKQADNTYNKESNLEKEERGKDKTRKEIKREEITQELISLDSSIYPSSFSKKQITLDLRLKLNTGENINVEMQSLSQKAFLERILFYWARLYTEDLKRGDSYEKLYPAYSLVFTNFDVLPSKLKDYVNSFSIRLDKKPYEELTDHLKIVIVELSKFSYESVQNLDKKASWCYVLKESERIGERELEILSERGLGGAMALLKNVSEDDRLRYEQESRDKFLFDLHWDKIYKFEEGMQKGLQKGRQEGRKEGKEEGIQKGLQKGRQEGRKEGKEEGIQKGLQKGREEIVLKMLKLNTDLDFISKVTGLTKIEIKNLKNS